MKKSALALLAFLLIPAAAFAADPDPSKNPVLAAVQKAGGKLFYLGSSAGLNGWFVVKDNQVQMMYAAPDNKSALIGALFGPDGDDITSAQVAALLQNNKEAATLVSAAEKEQIAITQAGSPMAAPALPIPTPNNTLPAAPLSPGESLIRDLSTSSTVILGNAASPEILMVMDPRCPHCQATWKAFHDSVSAGKIHLRLVPLGDEGSDSERAAAILLTSTSPAIAWDKFIGGDASALAGMPSDAALLGVRANRMVADKWHIENTPYLVYRAKNGKVKVEQGEPDKISVILQDLGA